MFFGNDNMTKLKFLDWSKVTLEQLEALAKKGFSVRVDGSTQKIVVI